MIEVSREQLAEWGAAVTFAECLLLECLGDGYCVDRITRDRADKAVREAASASQQIADLLDSHRAS